MAICAQTARLIYTAPHGNLVKHLLEEIQDAGKKSGLPNELWRSVVQKGEANVPREEFDQAIVKMNRDVAEYLEARSKE